jgi:hypothetical protein
VNNCQKRLHGCFNSHHNKHNIDNCKEDDNGTDDNNGGAGLVLLMMMLPSVEAGVTSCIPVLFLSNVVAVGNGDFLAAVPGQSYRLAHFWSYGPLEPTLT